MQLLMHLAPCCKDTRHYSGLTVIENQYGLFHDSNVATVLQTQMKLAESASEEDLHSLLGATAERDYESAVTV